MERRIIRLTSSRTLEASRVAKAGQLECMLLMVATGV